jgi:hypothetical protein
MRLDRLIRKIIVEQNAVDYPMTRRILARLKGVPVEIIRDREALKGVDRDRANWLPAAKRTVGRESKAHPAFLL